MISDPCSCGEVHALRAELETTRAARDEAELRAQAAERHTRNVLIDYRERLERLLKKTDLALAALDKPEASDVG